ncbi:MAG TPA: alpha-amylase family glycosyl hydrolase [Chloroflexia bacterium]|nr:alpha-amylase family glycosyl hydrolase [Chloroflexia bacterium]
MSRDRQYRDPVGAVPAGTTVTLRLKAGANDLTGTAVRVWDSRASKETVLPMRLERQEGDDDYWVVTVPTPPAPNVLWYRFLAQDGDDTAVYQDDRDRDGGRGEAVSSSTNYDYSINAYDPKWTVPAWMQDAVIYQIFPDRFNNGEPGNDRPAGDPVYDGATSQSAWGDPPKGNSEFYGGDLQGIIAKLDYLQSLGVTVLYLNPIFDAASNHGYDTRDYSKVAAWFGGQEAYDRLIAETKQRNMHVILDGVFNHSGSDSLYFDRYHHYPTDGAYESQQSPYFPLYRFPGWPDNYTTFSGFDTLPAFKEADPARDFLFRKPDSVAQRWLGAGAAGWRLDAATYKTNTFWRDLRTSVRGAYPDAVIIAEFGASAANAIEGLSGDQWDGVMNYRFEAAAWSFFKPNPDLSADELDNLLASEREDYGPVATVASMNLIDSHDTPRALSQMGEDKNRLRLLALLQFTSMGTPTVYYGDEVGLSGGGDPDDRRTYPWGQEDASLLAYYRALGQTRHAVSALRTGTTTTLLVHNDNRLYAYARHDDHGTAVVAFNAGQTAQTLDLNLLGLAPDGTVLKDVLTNGTGYTVTGGHINVPVGPAEGALLIP